MWPRPLDHIHPDGRVARGGIAPLGTDRAVILVHGRGATPESIPNLADELNCVGDTMRRLATRHRRELVEIGPHSG